MDYRVPSIECRAIKRIPADLLLEPFISQFQSRLLSFAPMRELTEGIAAVIDDIERLNSTEQSDLG
jgi:hypothetical protein